MGLASGDTVGVRRRCRSRGGFRSGQRSCVLSMSGGDCIGTSACGIVEYFLLEVTEVLYDLALYLFRRAPPA